MIFTLIMDGAANIGSEVENKRTLLDARRLHFGGALLRGRSGAGGEVDGCSRNDGVTKHPRAGIHLYGGRTSCMNELQRTVCSSSQIHEAFMVVVAKSAVQKLWR